MPRAEMPLRRHTLVTLTAAGWGAAFARDPALAADPLVQAWAARGRPLIMSHATADEGNDGSGTLGQPLQGLVVGAYFMLSWMRGGQTLGMRPWRIRVTDASGAPVNWKRGLARLIVAALPLALVLIYPLTSLKAALWAPVIGWLVLLLPAWFDRRRRAIHDMVAGTEIRRLPT